MMELRHCVDYNLFTIQYNICLYSARSRCLLTCALTQQFTWKPYQKVLFWQGVGRPWENQLLWHEWGGYSTAPTPWQWKSYHHRSPAGIWGSVRDQGFLTSDSGGGHMPAEDPQDNQVLCHLYICRSGQEFWNQSDIWPGASEGF